MKKQRDVILQVSHGMYQFSFQNFHSTVVLCSKSLYLAVNNYNFSNSVRMKIPTFQPPYWHSTALSDNLRSYYGRHANVLHTKYKFIDVSHPVPYALKLKLDLNNCGGKYSSCLFYTSCVSFETPCTQKIWYLMWPWLLTDGATAHCCTRLQQRHSHVKEGKRQAVRSDCQKLRSRKPRFDFLLVISAVYPRSAVRKMFGTFNRSIMWVLAK